MPFSENLACIKRNGFVNLGNSFLSTDELREFRQVCEKAFSEFDRGHKDFLDQGSGCSGFRALPLYSPETVNFIEKIITNPEIEKFISGAIGEEYKVWQIDYRRSLPGDQGLEVHQDGYGQLNMAICLSDNLHGSGGTFFLPGSHLIKKRIDDLKLKAPPVIFSLVSFLFKSLIAKSGDIAFFFNRTWHGRNKNTSNQKNDIILIGFYPVGALLSYKDPYVRWPDEFLEKIDGTKLKKLIDPNSNLKIQENGLYKIVSGKKQLEEPFSIQIEKNKVQHSFTDRFKLGIKTSVLSLIMSVGRIVNKVFKFLGLRKGRIA
jgi:putative 2OG-Fe(II) oxygenase